MATILSSASAQPLENTRSLPAFEQWLDREPARRASFAAFEAFLAANEVGDVVPAFELWRTATSAERCGADAFVVPERAHWDNVVPTLRFVRDFVEPTIGQVEVASAYRNEQLNACAGGSPGSAHRRYYALDLVPLDSAVTREALIHDLCRVHANAGAAHHVGLGFYTRTRFHVDTMRFRRWGADGRAASSPCLVEDRGDAPRN